MPYSGFDGAATTLVVAPSYGQKKKGPKRGSFEHFEPLYLDAQRLTPERRRDPVGREKLYRAYGWKVQVASQQGWTARAAFDRWRLDRFKGFRVGPWKAPRIGRGQKVTF